MRQARKGDRVQCNYRGKEHHGTVLKGGKKALHVRLDGLNKIIGGPVELFSPSDKPLPASESATGAVTSLKKWDRVCCELDGETLHGVISKGGSNKVEMVIDGGKEAVKGHVSSFSTSDKELPKDPPDNVMNKYGVIGYKELSGHGDSRTFEADITLNGKKVIRVMNDGHGGCNEYHTISPHGSREILSQFREDAKTWWEEYSSGKPFESDDFWVEWYQHKRPFGVTSKMYLEEHDQEMSKLFEEAAGRDGDDQDDDPRM